MTDRAGFTRCAVTLDEMFAKLGKREGTMRLALKLLEQRGGSRIIETGCAREPDNWSGDGMSTLVFAQWIREHGGSLRTIDNDVDHLAACKLMVGYPIQYTLAHSVAALRRNRRRIDLLYLDSLDYLFGALCDLYGGKTDLDVAIATLRAMPEAEIVAQHHEIIDPSQQHCRAEVSAAMPMLPLGALVLIDDAGLPGGGKARLAKKLLWDAGWECLADEYQTLWSKPYVAEAAA